MALSQKEGVRQWYNQIAKHFVRRYDGWDGWYYRHFEEMAVLRGADFRDLRVLDLGTGPGRFVASVCQEARQAVGVDLSEAMIEMARQIVRAPNVQFEVMDATHMTFENESFDAVVSLGMFEYMDNLAPVLSEANRVLRPGGTFVMIFHQQGRDGRFLTENPEDDYYGAKVKDRNALWTKVYHRRAAIRESLESSGYQVLQIQRIMFRLPIRLLSWIRRIFHQPNPIALALAKVPLACEHFERHLPWLAGSSGVAIAFAKKSTPRRPESSSAPE